MDNQLTPSIRFAARPFVLLACWLSLQCPGQVPEHSGGLNAPVVENTAVRFFYQPTLADHFHEPLIVRVVGQNDPRIGTSPFTSEGRSAFVFISEMRQLIGKLAGSGVPWRDSDKVEMLGPSHRLKVLGELDITIVSSRGTTKGIIEPRRICEFLAGLDAAIRSPRALWEFQNFRLDYSCDVPGFNRNAYPDHYRYK